MHSSSRILSTATVVLLLPRVVSTSVVITCVIITNIVSPGGQIRGGVLHVIGQLGRGL